MNKLFIQNTSECFFKRFLFERLYGTIALCTARETEVQYYYEFAIHTKVNIKIFTITYILDIFPSSKK